MKKLLLLLMALFLWAGSSWAVTVTIGTGTSTQRQPFGMYWGYERSASIYTYAEMTTYGTITTIAWYVGTAQTTNCPTKIYLKTTTATTLTAQTWATMISGATTVYDATRNYTPSGWLIIDITDFNYSSDNLLVLCETNYGGGGTGTYPTFRYTSSTSRHEIWYADSSPPTGNGTVGSLRPNIQFNITTTSPSLSAVPSTINFGYVASGSTYEYPTPYVLSGTNLTAGPIVVTAPSAAFEVSLTGGGVGFGSSVNVTYTPPTLTATNIYVRFKPTGPPASYSGNITNVGGGASRDVAVSGSSYMYARYCTSTATSATDEDIFNVTIGSLNNSSTCATTGGIGSVLNMYSNYTTTVAAVNLGQGSVNAFSVQIGTCGGNYGNAVKIFIDYNSDGDFADAGEEAYVSAASTSGPHTETGNITIPPTATLGLTMMRVVNVETGTPSGILACGTYTWGETEDYLVNITPPPACVAPVGLSVTNITTVGADLGWSSTDSFFDIFIQIDGGPDPGPATTPTVNNHNALTYTWSGGSPATTYDWWVRTDCAAGGGTGQSDWVAGSTFTTLCLTYTLPFTESFNTASFPACWSQTSTLSPRWNVNNTNGAGGTAYEMRGSYTSGTGTSRLITPPMNLSVASPHLIYKQMYDDYGVGVSIGVQTSINGGASWVTEWSYAGGSGNIAAETKVIPLTNYGASTLIAWFIDGNHYQIDYWYVDDVVVQDGAPVVPGLWTGAVDTDWSNKDNWDDATTPDGTVAVTIPAGCPNYPYITGITAECLSLTIQNGGGVYMVDSFFDIFTEVNLDGELQIDGGTVDIVTDLNGKSNGLLDMNGGILNIGGGIYESGSFTWASSDFELSGGTINVTYHAAFYGGVGTMNGPFNLNGGGSAHMGADVFTTVTGGTVTLTGTAGTPQYFLPPSGTGTGVAYNLVVNAAGTNYIFSRDANVNGDHIYNDFLVEAGTVQLQSTSGTGSPGTFAVDGDVTVKPDGGFNSFVTTTFNVGGNLVLEADATGYGSWIDNGYINVAKGIQEAQVAYDGLKWHMISAPIPTAVSGMFTGLYLQKHAESTNLWSDIETTTEALNVGQGYALYNTVAGTHKALFEKSFNTGGQNMSLTRNNQGWNAVGNPYPSAIDWDAASGWTKTNVANATYVENAGLWASYIAGAGTNGGSRYISPGQGFFVECTDAGGGTLAMTKDVRTLTKTFPRNWSGYRLRVTK
ncbi:MAG: hypothetical protein FJY07_05225 [Bacteroidetes bacterium]|nr:hypothetical protein [Bacteroidota bacterium]